MGFSFILEQDKEEGTSEKNPITTNWFYVFVAKRVYAFYEFLTIERTLPNTFYLREDCLEEID